jgi:hypothetical protein
MTTPPKPHTFNGDLSKLPRALEHLCERPIWVCWKWSWDGRKWTKPPRRVDNPDVNASSSDPSTWGTHKLAVKQVRDGKADGIGFAIKGSSIGGFDLDHCHAPETGMIDTWAQEYLDQFPDCYVEVTVSGTGLRILGTSEIENFSPKFKLPHNGNGAAIELFSNSNHYLTLSCNQLGACFELPPIGNVMEVIAHKLSGATAKQRNDLPLAKDAPSIAPELISPWSFAEDMRLRSALSAIPTDEKRLVEKFGSSHNTWVNVGRAIERLDWGEKGFAIWRDWCAQNSAKFNEKGLRDNWRSLQHNRNTRDKPVTVGTLYYYAKEFGWKDTDKATDDDFAPKDPGPFDVGDFKGPAPLRRWIVEDWIVEGVVNSLYGSGGIGKTLIAQQLAYCLALPTPFLGIDVEHKTSFCVLCEDDINELHRRHDAIKAGLGHPYDNPFKGNVTVWPRVGLDNLLVTWDHQNRPCLTQQFREIWIEVLKKRPDLLVLDTLADVYGGNEIVRVQVNHFIKTVLGRLILQAKDAGFTLTVLLLAHPSMAGEASGTGMSGSTAWENAVRARLYMLRPKEGHFDERELVRAKANYSASGEDTVLRMIYQSGFFVPAIGAEEIALQSAKEHLRQIVAAAWGARKPYVSKKGHKRNLHTAGLAALQARGVKKETGLQAIRDAIDDGDIFIKKRDDSQGYTTQKGDGLDDGLSETTK